MSLTLNVRADVRRVTKDLGRLQRHVVPEATRDALNRTNRGVRTDAVRAVSKTLGITPQKRVRRRIFIPKRMQATKNKLTAGGLTLFNYVPEIYVVGRGKKAGRAAQGKNKFLATMDSGHQGLYRRKGNKRLPIAEFFVDRGQEVAQAVDGVIERAGRRRWPPEFDRQLKRRLRRR